MDLFEQVIRRHPPPWGDVLDAGTGASSWDWLLKQPCRSRTGVTAEAARAQALRNRPGMGPLDEVIEGLWQDAELLQGRRFDVVLADYLLGACDRYAPYFQEEMIERILAKCSGWLFLVGLEPPPPPTSAGQRCLFEVGQLRDAVQLLLGHRPHRELPQAWVERHFESRGARIAWRERYHNLYDADWVAREIASLEQNLQLFEDRGLAQVLRRRCHSLRQRAEQCLTRPTSYSFDYLLGVDCRFSEERPATVGPPPG